MARPLNDSPELCRRAIAEGIERDRLVAEVARDLGVGSPETLRNWAKHARCDAGLQEGRSNAADGGGLRDTDAR